MSVLRSSRRSRRQHSTSFLSSIGSIGDRRVTSGGLPEEQRIGTSGAWFQFARPVGPGRRAAPFLSLLFEGR